MTDIYLFSNDPDEQELKFNFKQFWCGQYQASKDCCYNHHIGLPEKSGQRHPIYPYEEALIGDLAKYRYLSILKATGLGITEFLLRYAEYKCLTEYKNAQIVIIVGPNRDLAKMQIERIEKHLIGKIPHEATDYEIRMPYQNIIKAFPSMNIDAARSLENPKLILIDEASFFPMVQDIEVRAIAERYEAKSGAQVIVYSTPGDPEGMFYDLMKEDPSQYVKRYLDYTKGLQPHPSNLAMTIYTKEAIEEAKKSPSFEREYNLQWGYGRGNIFDQNALDFVSLETYDPMPLSDSAILAIDPGFGSSQFAIVGAEKRDGIIYILHAEQFEQASFPEMVTRIKEIMKSYGYAYPVFDASNPELAREFTNHKKISFKEKGQKMTLQAAKFVTERKIRIDRRYQELLRQLRAVQKNDKGTADKKRLSFDLGDAFLMAVEELTGGRVYAALMKG